MLILIMVDNLDFCHDIGGIYTNFDRDTKQLENCFVPRCALPQVRDNHEVEIDL